MFRVELRWPQQSPAHAHASAKFMCMPRRGAGGTRPADDFCSAASCSRSCFSTCVPCACSSRHIAYLDREWQKSRASLSKRTPAREKWACNTSHSSSARLLPYLGASIGSSEERDNLLVFCLNLTLRLCKICLQLVDLATHRTSRVSHFRLRLMYGTVGAHLRPRGLRSRPAVRATRVHGPRRRPH